MATFSIRSVAEDPTDSPYVDVIYTLEEEMENATDYQEGGFGSVGTLAKSSNCSDLASFNASTASLGDPEAIAVDYDDHEDYIWVTGKSCILGYVNMVVTGSCCFSVLWGFVTHLFLSRPRNT